MPHPYLLSLAAEYVELVNTLKSGGYTRSEWRELDSQRQVTHNQLLDILNLTRDDDADMYERARAILFDVRGRNQQ